MCSVRGVHKLRWQVFVFFDHLPPYVDIFYLTNVDKKLTFLNYLPTSSCQRSLWTAPKIDWKESQETSKNFVRKFREETTKVNLSLIFRKDKGYLRVEIEWHLNQGWHDLYVFTIWNRVTFEFPIPLQGQSLLNSHWNSFILRNARAIF